MTTITIDRAVVEQALEALKDDQYRLVEVSPNQYEYKTGLLVEVGPNQYEYKTDLAIAALERALAQRAEPTVKESLQVPPEVAATLTTSDIAWLETRRLTKLWRELGQMRWAGADEGWDRAIDAVRIRLNDECHAVLHWKATADQSQATAVELLRKMQGDES